MVGRLRLGSLAAFASLTAACTGAGPTSQSANDPSVPTPSAGSAVTSVPAEQTEDEPGRDCRPPEAPPPAPEGAAVELDEVGAVGDVRVSAALYPLPDGRGSPWSQWGQGVVLPDGRFVSAVGDHLGVDGNSWFFEYDPATGVLTRTTEVGSALGQRSGDWGYGKIHAPLLLGPCDDVLGATYWGTRRGLVTGGSYHGDHLIRYDPVDRDVTSLGVPIAGFGVPSLAISPDRRFVYGEAVDPSSDPDAGPFFVADASTGEILIVDDDPAHVGFRSILVSADGAAYFSAGDGRLFRQSPGTEPAELHEDELPGSWLRAASPIAPNGTVFGVSRDPDHLFRFDTDGTISDLGPTGGYVTSLGMSPDGDTLYFVPDAHGGAWRQGTPLIAVDTETGDRQVVVQLNPLIENALDVRAGGTYNVVVDPTGRYVHVGLNTSAEGSDDREATFGSVVLAVVDLGG